MGALGYEQSPGKGQTASLNLAVEEQQRALTWVAELTIAITPVCPTGSIAAKGQPLGPDSFLGPKLSSPGRRPRQAKACTMHTQASNKLAKKLKAKKVHDCISCSLISQDI